MKLTIIIALQVTVCLFGMIELANSQASSSMNYVMTNTVKQAGITNEGMVPAISIATQGKSQSIAYIDGLGRPLQTVVTQGSASQKDIIVGNEYDVFGREVKKYLPYADINNTANPGSFKPAWNTTQAGFYNGQLQGVDIDAAPYSQSVLEASPLNRMLAQGAPGTVWQPNINDAYDASKKTIQVHYEINLATDNVRIFNVDMSTGAISTSSFYGDGLLTVKRSLDEHQNTTKEFTDKSGHLILKQVYIENNAIIQTYYIYDDLDLLRAVIQPEGVALIPATGSWTPTTSFLNTWTFQYTFDARNRMITKKVPGAGLVNMMYDKWDRLVLTQDANQVNNQWLFTKYDALNRPVMTGLIIDTRSRTAIQTDLDAAGRFETVNRTVAEGYTTTGCFPSSSSYTLTIYTMTHYDSYGFQWGSGYGFWAGNGVNSYNNNVQGQVVATQARVLGTNTFLRSVIYYDEKYRPIYTITDHGEGGQYRDTRLLSFDGKLLQEFQTHYSAVYTTGLVTLKTYTYDHADRVLKIMHQLGAGETVTLAENSYNELGQLLNKKLHQSASHPAYLQKLDYAYNIRGWLNGVNQPYSNGTGYDETDLFNFKLNYNTTDLSGTAQFNGNIAEQVWKGGYDEYLRGYKYGYDKANRLTTSDYGFKYLNSNNSMVWDYSMRYNENITGYDLNGNIKSLERFHGSWNRVDQLGYTYVDANNGNAPDGNRLHKVVDAVYNNLPVGFTDHDNWFNDYNYDNNGNITWDYNKGITGIQYNHLNLPTLVTFGTKGTIAYTYDATGSKLQKTVTDQSVSPNKITITKYAGSFVYTNSYLAGSAVPAETLEFIGHEEGRIRPAKIDPAQALTAANSKYIYDYFMKDHLGNTRMVLTTEQQTNIYAATIEPANAGTENSIFNNIVPEPKPNNGAGVRFDDIAANTKVVKLNGANASTRVGPSIILKVMPGDVISISTKGWYKDNSPAALAVPSGLQSFQQQLLDLLTAGIVGNAGTHSGAVLESDIRSASSGVLSDFLTNTQPPNYNTSRPKAFLNWIIVDEEFKKVSSSFHMGAVQIPSMTSADIAKTLVGPLSMTVRRGGWLYVYVSNESNQDVYFDDLVINHQRGAVVEQNHYYPFGLEIPGLASKAIGFGTNPINRLKYNKSSELQSNEFSDGSGWETYDAVHRMYNPQLGRFMQIDPLGELNENISPYSFVNNNPILLNDPLGLAGDTTIKGQVIKRDNDLSEVTVTGCHPCKPATQSSSSGVLAFIFFGVDRADKYYGTWESSYDHLNYFTTKGKLKPFPFEARRMSRQARMFKQRSNIVSQTALSLSVVSTILTAVQVRNQYLEGESKEKGSGMSNIEFEDGADLTLGTVGLVATGLSKFNLFPKTLGVISNGVGMGTIALSTYQNWMTAFNIMYNTNLPDAHSYSGNAKEQFQAEIDDFASGGDRWNW